MGKLAVRLREMIGCGMELVGKVESMIDEHRNRAITEDERNNLIGQIAGLVQAGPTLRSQIDVMIREEIPVIVPGTQEGNNVEVVLKPEEVLPE